MKLSKLCAEINLPFNGDDIDITGIGTLDSANANQLSFFHSPKYIESLKSTKAGAVLIEEKYLEYLPSHSIALLTDEPYLKLALATALFAHPLSNESEEPTLLEGAKVDESVKYGKGVEIGKDTLIMAGCYIGDDVKIGDRCIIHPNTTIYHGVEIGDDCIIHSGAVIGSDGYGFAHTADGRHIKIHQIGGVIIENSVEIGANTTIDRGAIGNTVIKTGTKIDNLVQIGHNCNIGENSLIVSQVGLSGSTTLGRNVIMGGQSATAGHLKIGDFAVIAARGGVTKSLEGSRQYGGFPAVEIRLWKKMQVALSRLVKK